MLSQRPVYYLFFYPCLKSLMRVSDIPEVEGAAAVAAAQVEVEVALVAHLITTTALDTGHPLVALPTHSKWDW